MDEKFVRTEMLIGKDGIKRNVTEIQALDVVFCGGYGEPKEPENIEQDEEIYNGEVPF